MGAHKLRIIIIIRVRHCHVIMKGSSFHMVFEDHAPSRGIDGFRSLRGIEEFQLSRGTEELHSVT